MPLVWLPSYFRQSVTPVPLAGDAVQYRHEWSIEALRGVAAILVVIVHYAPLTQANPGLLKFAFTGVDLFFVISGYVFAPYIFGKRMTWLPFALRRFFRLYPAYVVALCTYVALTIAEGRDTPHILKHLLFLQTLESSGIAFYYNPAFWSLPPEVEFYVLLPFLGAFVARHLTFWPVFAFALTLHLAIAYLSPAAAGQVDAWFILGVHVPGLLVEFLIGAATWKLAHAGFTVGTRALLITTGVCAWLLLAALYVRMGDQGVAEHVVLRGNLAVLAASSFGLVVAGWVGMIRNPPRLIWWGALMAGNLSYGIYLFHNAAPGLIRQTRLELSNADFVAACSLLTVIMAVIVHYGIERPLRLAGRNMADRLERQGPGV